MQVYYLFSLKNAFCIPWTRKSNLKRYLILYGKLWLLSGKTEQCCLEKRVLSWPQQPGCCPGFGLCLEFWTWSGISWWFCLHCKEFRGPSLNYLAARLNYYYYYARKYFFVVVYSAHFHTQGKQSCLPVSDSAEKPYLGKMKLCQTGEGLSQAINSFWIIH